MTKETLTFVTEKTKELTAGAKYCDCPACAACEAILARKEELFK